MTYSVEELVRLASEANILRLLGEGRNRQITIDVVPARGEIIIPRLSPDDEDNLTPLPPVVDTLTYHLEDQMFGSECYAAITCGGKVVVRPFPFVSWEKLANDTIKLIRE